MTRWRFDAQLGPYGALLIGEPGEVVEKVLRHDAALGGILRITFQMNASSLPHAKLMRAIELLHAVAPAIRRSWQLVDRPKHPSGRAPLRVAFLPTS